jgi:phosphoserine phosphatase RsbU/P
MVEKTSVLRGFFDGVDETSLETLRQVARMRTYPPNTVLVQQGAIEHTFYVVVSGRVKALHRLESGDEQFLGFVDPPNGFGEMALIDDSPRMATCVTTTETTVLEMDEEIFDQVVENNPEVAYSMIRGILERARDNNLLAIDSLNKKNADLRLALEDLKQAQQRLLEKERLQRELELAVQVQNSLLPESLPDLPPYSFAAYLKPARMVGGDLYDVVDLDETHVGLVLADVADKGFHAALFMAVTRTLFLQEGKHSLSPAVVAQAVHQGLMDVSANDDMFVTAFYGVLHRPSGLMIYVRAAQERPLLYRPGESVRELPADGRFLGMFETLELAEDWIQLMPGDRLIVFSDGVPDAVNPAGERYGYERLHAALISGGHLDAEALCAHLVADLTRWTAGADPFDDVTLLVTARSA